jgi:hypothetical protein
MLRNPSILPLLQATKDYYCQYCSKVYKSSSKRKAHILKNHPGLQLPLPARHLKANGATENGEPEDPQQQQQQENDSNVIAAVVPVVAGGSAASAAASAAEVVNSTFSATVGNVTSLPHNCPFCHKQVNIRACAIYLKLLISTANY